MLRETLRILASKLLFVADRPRTTLFRVDMRLFIFSQTLPLFHREDVQVQPKNICSWLSFSYLQKVQNVSVWWTTADLEYGASQV